MSTRKTTLGYIVWSNNPMELDDRDGLLYFGSVATLIPTRRAAKVAIKRTLCARPRWIQEGFLEMRVKRVVTS